MQKSKELIIKNRKELFLDKDRKYWKTENVDYKYKGDEGFAVNKEKSRIIREGNQQIITGVSIASGNVKLPREIKREIRKNVHCVIKTGLFAHMEHIGIFDPIYMERLIGKLYFWKSLEPDNKFVTTYIPVLREYLRQM